MKKILDLLIFILFNLTFVDNIALVFPIAVFALVVGYMGINEEKSYMVLLILFFALLISLLFLKLFSLIIYEKFYYKRVSSPLVIKLIEKMRVNKNSFRKKFSMLISAPYILLAIGNTIVQESLTDLIAGFVILIFVSGLVPYLIFFKYLDKKSTKSNN